MPDTDVDGAEKKVFNIDDGSPATIEDAGTGIYPPSKRGGRGRNITDLLIELGYATREQIDFAIQKSRQSPGQSPKQILLDEATISPDQLSRALAERFGLHFLDLSEFKVNFTAVNLIDVETARRYRAVPVEYVDEGTVLLAVTDPANVLALDDLAIATGHSVRPAVASPSDIEVLIGQMSKLDENIEAAISTEEEEEPEEITDIRESAQDAPIIRLTNAIIAQALESKASDVHLDPGDNEMQIRYRIDGVLTDATTLPKRMIPGVVSRVKVMADLDIAEHRIPQDGRVTLKVGDHPVDIRVVTLPSSRGEAVVMRLLDKEQSIFSLNKLGLAGDALKRFESAIGKPYGATFVTGPTGSGKTTTLYAGLQILNTRDKSILTIEDPVEYQIDSVTQIQVHKKAGLTFSNGLRSMLRADPDIMMVGEVRDHETARISIEAALTGHLVLTTLHTNDAPSAITRLIDMGIEPFLIASALDCVVAQRLTRQLCDHCKKPVKLSAESLTASGFIVDKDESIDGFEAAGCQRCNSSGFKGRLGVFEVMKVSEEIRQMTIDCTSVDKIRKQALKEGMQALREDGLNKIRLGISSVDEITRVIS